MTRLPVAAAVALAAVGAIVAAALADAGPPSRGPGWGALQPSPLERTEVGAGLVGDGIFVAGGFVPEGGDTGAIVRYDIGDDSWTGGLAPHPFGINHAGVTAAGGMVYVLGGQRGAGDDHISRRLHRYDPTGDDWQRLADLPAPRSAMAFVAIDDRLYAAGGRLTSSARGRTLEIYDISEDRWISGPDMNVGRNHVAGAASNGKLYVIGGRPGQINGGKRTVERYNPQTRRWKIIEPLDTARSGAAAATLADGRIVVFGGEELATPSDETIEEVELYDPATRAWSGLADMTTPRHGLGGVAVGSRVYALEGGPQPGLRFSDANEYLDVAP